MTHGEIDKTVRTSVLDQHPDLAASMAKELNAWLSEDRMHE